LALPEKMQAGERFGLAYIDGSHAFHEALLDFYYVRHLLDEGGIALFDDCSTPDLRRLIRFIKRHIKSFKEFDLSPYRPDGRSLRYQVALALGKAQCRAFQKVSSPDDDERHTWECD
jgi:hypothetical protein